MECPFIRKTRLRVRLGGGEGGVEGEGVEEDGEGQAKF